MQTDMVAQKKILRRGANALGQDCAQARAALDHDLCAQFLKAFPPDPSKILAFFWPMARECDTREIAEKYAAAGVTCALPVIKTQSHGLLFRQWWPEGTMVKSSFGTFEPCAEHEELKPDIILVPLVMVDTHGTRLGRGAGHYDATLAALRRDRANEILAIGVAYDWQVSQDALPHEVHDERLDGLVTPTQFILFP